MKMRELRLHTVEQLIELKVSLQRELLCFHSAVAIGSIRSKNKSMIRRVLARVLTKLNHEGV